MKKVITSFLIFITLSSNGQIKSLKIGYQEFPTKTLGHAVDISGNMYYSGNYKGELTVEGKVLQTGVGLNDLFLIKKDVSDKTIFSKSFGSKNDDVAVADGLCYLNNNLYLAAQILDVFDLQTFSVTPYSKNGINISTNIIANLDTSGIVKWVNKTSLTISKVFAADHIIHVLGVTSGDVKYNEKVIYTNLPQHSIVHLMLDTSGNLLAYRSIISQIPESAYLQAPLSISSYTDGKLSMLFSIYGDSSFQFGQKIIPLPFTQSLYYVLVKTDTSYSDFSYKVLNPVPVNFLYTNGLFEFNMHLSKEDSTYLILSIYGDSTILNYDGLDIPIGYSKNTLVVLDASLKASRVVDLGNVFGTDANNTGRRRIFFNSITTIKNNFFISGTFQGLNESPVTEISHDKRYIYIVPNLNFEVDFNGASESFVAKTSLGFLNGSLFQFGNHSNYENSSLLLSFSHTVNDSTLIYSFADDNVWNPRIVKAKSKTVSGSMLPNADLPDDLKFVEYLPDGSRIVIGYARGETSLDTSSTGIRCNRNRNDAFIARITSSDEVKWYKRLGTTLQAADAIKVLMRDGKLFFLINFNGSVNENNFISIDQKNYSVQSGLSLLASVDSTGNINVINLENNYIKGAYINDFNLFKNGDVGILTRVDYFNFKYVLPFAPGFFLFRVNPTTHELLSTRKVITHDGYTYVPSNLEIDDNDILYISTAIYFYVNPADRFTTIKLHNGTNVIDSIKIENNVGIQGGVSILKMDFNKFKWYKRSSAGVYFFFNGYTSPTISSHDKIIFMARPFALNAGDTVNQNLYWDGKLIKSDMNASKFLMLRMDTSGKVEMQKSMDNFQALHTKKKANGNLLISGFNTTATNIDTINIEFQGKSDAVSFIIDSNFKALKSFRLATPYEEVMTDVDIFKDSIISFAYRAQTIPSVYLNRTEVIKTDYDADAFLSSDVISNLVVLPLQLLSFNALRTDNIVYLNWAIISGKEGKKIIIQRSENGSAFKDIEVKESINSISAITYRTTNILNNYGMYNYRLQLISKNGQITYSKIIQILFSAIKGSFYYDVNSYTLNILRKYNKMYDWRIFDESGKIILSGEKTIGNKPINLRSLPPGIYIVKTFEDKSDNQTYKFIK